MQFKREDIVALVTERFHVYFGMLDLAHKMLVLTSLNALKQNVMLLVKLSNKCNCRH